MLYSQYKKQVWFDRLIGTTAMIIMLIIFWCSLNYAFKKQDQITCLKWQKYEQDYPNFKVTKNMAELCGRYNINFKP